MCVGGGKGKNLCCSKYTPLYEKGIKKTQNKSMETTNDLHLIFFSAIKHANINVDWGFE